MNPDERQEVKVSLHVADPEPGQTFAGHYRIEEIIGSGGMGRIYRVVHTLMGKPFALKLIRPQRDLGSNDVQRFLNEAKTLHDLQHENIVRIFEFGVTDDGCPYQILEFIDGKTLSVASKPELESEKLLYADKLEIAIQLAQGLAHAHKNGVVHRDIKSSNVLINKDREGKLVARIIDFGIAKLETHDGATITKTGDVIGSPAFVSPEQALGQPLDARSDIYSLGVVFYEMFTGRLPFEESTPMAQIVARLNGPAPEAPLRTVGSEALQRVILHMLEMDRDKRYPTADDLLADLRRVKAGVPIVIRRQNNFTGLIVTGAALAILLAGGFLVTSMSQHQQMAPTTGVNPPQALPGSTDDPMSAAFDIDQRAYRFFTAGKYQDALDMLKFGELAAQRRVKEDNSRNNRWFQAENQFFIGQCYEGLKQWPEAEEYYAKVWKTFLREFKRQNMHASALHTGYVHVLREQGKLEEADRVTKEYARFRN
jgi:serine/threonine protein kinase